MKSLGKIWVVAVLYLFLYSFSAYAIKSNAKIINYREPDGSIIQIVARGDEFFSYFLLPNGALVMPGKDGYLYYASLGTNGLTLSLNRVGASQRDIPTKSLHNLWSETIQNLSARQVAGKPQGRVRNISGEVNSLVLLVEFADVKFTMDSPADYFGKMLNERGFSQNGAGGSVADYFNDNFCGKASFSFTLSPILTLSQKRAYYGERGALANDARSEEFILEACSLAQKQGVDFSLYDSDSDGTIDNISIIFAGVDEAQSGVTESLWPMWGDLSPKGNTIGGLRIGSYTYTAELDYNSTYMKGLPASIGIFAHEFAHYLGLPDMYDLNGEEEGKSNALFASLSLMDEGAYSNGGHTPPYFTAIERELLGVAPVKELAVGASYSLPIYPDADSIYRISLYEPGEYLLLESRGKVGWDKYCGGEGLVIYHIDKSENMCGGLTAKRRWEHNIINTFAEHECAKVVWAAKPDMPTTDLHSLFYPGKNGVVEASFKSENPLVDWRGRPLGFKLRGISFKGGLSTFELVPDLGWSEEAVAISQLSVTPYMRDAHIKWNYMEGADTTGGFVSISWSEKEAELEQSRVATATGSDFLIPDLKPDSEYSVTLFFYKELQMAKEVKTDFRTETITSIYPYLKIKGEYRVGERVYFRVMNQLDNVAELSYSVNGVAIKEDHIRFEKAGEYILRVLVDYTDGSTDCITKRISVN